MLLEVKAGSTGSLVYGSHTDRKYPFHKAFLNRLPIETSIGKFTLPCAVEG